VTYEYYLTSFFSQKLCTMLVLAWDDSSVNIKSTFRMAIASNIHRIYKILPGLLKKMWIKKAIIPRVTASIKGSEKNRFK